MEIFGLNRGEQELEHQRDRGLYAEFGLSIRFFNVWCTFERTRNEFNQMVKILVLLLKLWREKQWKPIEWITGECIKMCPQTNKQTIQVHSSSIHWTPMYLCVNAYVCLRVTQKPNTKKLYDDFALNIHTFCAKSSRCSSLLVAKVPLYHFNENDWRQEKRTIRYMKKAMIKPARSENYEWNSTWILSGCCFFGCKFCIISNYIKCELFSQFQY